LNYVISGPNRKRAEELVQNILPFLRPGERILDIGAGRALVADTLISRGFDVSLVDVADLSLVPHLKPEIYNGERLPYPNDSFDVALLLTVLHHIPNPDNTLAEARRVARRVVVLEDVYTSETEKLITWLGDSWLNWEFADHPHSNRSDADWRTAFSNLDLRVVEARQRLHWFFPFRFRHATYVLERA
jgi:ubiquinone/menaquinone biosynthesis C-methylase UbiE